MKFVVGFFAGPILLVLFILALGFAFLPVLIWQALELNQYTGAPLILNIIWLCLLMGLIFQFGFKT